MELAVIGMGGALGAIARYLLDKLVAHTMGGDFPWGIFLVNISGSFLMGIGYVYLVEQSVLPAIMRPALLVGFLGAFTTFSTFSLQALALLEVGRFAAAALYTGGSVVLAILGVFFGMALARSLVTQ